MNEHSADELLLLLGHPPAADFFHVVRTLAIGGEQADTLELTREWRNASAHVRALQQSESALGVWPTLDPLPPSLSQLAEACLQDQAVMRTHQVMPRRWALVELDRLTIFQKRINLSWIAQLRSLIGQQPTAETLFGISSGSGLPAPAVRVTRSDDHTYTFTCNSGELRFLGMRLLEPSGALGDLTSARPTHVVGSCIGFGLNLLSAVHFRNRLILTNGSHRAYALRSLGVTHAPCWVAEAHHEDDLELLGVREVRAQLDRYVRASRPPLFKDYFDPALRKVISVPRTDHAIQLQLTLKTLRLPAAL